MPRKKNSPTRVKQKQEQGHTDLVELWNTGECGKNVSIDKYKSD